MVIGDRFAWAHVPKTGGDTTQAMFEAVPGLVRFADPVDSNDKHLGFANREQHLRGKLLAMNIRRLPAWVLSASRHTARSGLAPDFRPLPLPSSDEMAEDTKPSGMLWWMMDGGRLEIDRWLRTERLAEDVIALIEEVVPLDAATRGRLRTVDRRNAAPYDHRLASYFTADQVRRLYALNPFWSEIERAAFGNLLSETPAWRP